MRPNCLVSSGFLEAMYVQTTAVMQLCQILDIDKDVLSKHPKLLEIRDIRAATVGHPTLKDRHYKHGEVTVKATKKKSNKKLKSFNFISRGFFSKQKISLISYYDNGNIEQKEIDPSGLIADQQENISQILRKVFDHLEVEGK